MRIEFKSFHILLLFVERENSFSANCKEKGWKKGSIDRITVCKRLGER